MTTEVFEVEGIAKHARLFEHNRDMGSTAGVDGAKYDYPEATSLNVVLDQQELSKVTKANPKTKPEVTEDGIEIKFKRRWVNNVASRGGPAKVRDAEGNTWDPQVAIGNGSRVKVAAETYDTQFGKAMRLLGVQVLELVPWEPGEGDEVAPEDLPEWLR